MADIVPLEAEEQATFIAWLRVQGIKHHHSPNETGSSPEARRRAIRMKRQGVSPGFPDLIVLIRPSQSHDGRGYLLLPEMKRVKGGKVSPDQRAWIAALNGLGCDQVESVIAHGAEEAIEYVSSYLSKKTIERVNPF